MKTPASLQGVAPLILRLFVGGMFMAHGSQKLFGLWDGKGLVETGKAFSQIGFHPGIFWAGLAGSSEFFAGLCLALGLLTRWATLPLMVVMMVAIVKVHWPHGFFIQKGGFEYPFIILGSLMTLFLLGGGKWSLDCLQKPTNFREPDSQAY